MISHFYSAIFLGGLIYMMFYLVLPSIFDAVGNLIAMLGGN